MTRICRGLRPLSKRDAVFETLSSIVPFFRTVWKLERTFFSKVQKKVSENTEYIQCLHFSTFAWEVKSVNDNFRHLSGFWVRKFVNFSVISREISWNYLESSVNGNSWNKTEVKHDSMKCKYLLPSVNFLWMWIHWPITTFHHFINEISSMQNSWQHCTTIPNYFGILKFSEL